MLAIARLWLSEGIPFAFRAQPGLYEIVRGWIATRLSIHPKELTLIGSARSGSSIVPKKAEKPFDDQSDLDWSAISLSLFEKCRGEFETWATEYRSGIVKPRQSTEKTHWEDNLTVCPRTMHRGFIDANKIPTWHRYPLSKLIADTMWCVWCKCNVTPGAPTFKRSTIRVYKDWDSFVRQLAMNLDSASNSRA